MTTQTDADLALIEPLDGLHVGLLTIPELEALGRLARAGLADRVYEGAAGFLGLPKVRIRHAPAPSGSMMQGGRS